MPRSLDLDRLRQFEPESPPTETLEEGRGAVPPERWPSREAQRDGQISIKAPLGTLARFRHLCRDDRRTYADMLAILMDAYERRHSETNSG